MTGGFFLGELATLIIVTEFLVQIALMASRRRCLCLPSYSLIPVRACIECPFPFSHCSSYHNHSRVPKKD